MHLIEINLRQFRIVSKLESQCISSNIFYDSFKFCPGRNSIAFHRKLPKTIPIWVWAETQLHLTENNLRQFHIESQSKFICISSILLYDDSKMCPSHNSIATLRSYSKTIPKCVVVEIHLHLIEIILWQFRTVSQWKFKCIRSNLF